ncbi:MAG: hypothetical protein HC797_06990 [Anaerolineales bacterium]|nr:hypothetical protein [Anaerolineales bacterium]
MRFLVDLISQATLLAIIGYWLVMRNSKKVFNHLANFLVIVTLVTSILLSFSSETSRIEKLNPELIQKINSFFLGK